LWDWPEIVELAKEGIARDFHQCAFGAPWRKFTRIHFWQCDS
jgi:hypothetical protein